MSDSSLDFYDQLAGDYHLIFADWKQTVLRQSDILDKLVRGEGFAAPATILDCSCGIGTQAIGLALKGYTVHATDLSPAAVTRAAQEATNFGVQLTTGVADLRTLDTQVEGLYDVVISMDNSLPHLLTDADLHQAARGIAAKTRSGGLFLASIRDYDQLLTDKPRSTTPQLYEDSSGRRVTFQIWDWQQDAHYYTLNHFILKEQAGSWQTTHHATTYRALRRTELEGVLTQSGFIDVHWLMPEASHFYQPIIVAHKA